MALNQVKQAPITPSTQTAEHTQKKVEGCFTKLFKTIGEIFSNFLQKLDEFFSETPRKVAKYTLSHLPTTGSVKKPQQAKPLSPWELSQRSRAETSSYPSTSSLDWGQRRGEW